MPLIAIVAAVAVFTSACSSPSAPPDSDSGAAAPAASPSEDFFEKIKRVSGGNCTPGRNAASHLAGIGFFCLPFDAIPAVDDPSFVSVAGADFLPDVEPVAALEVDGRHRAYPLRILITHEIVNDTVAGRPVVVSFCPLCNSATAFDRRVGNRTLIFGVSGQLLSANLVMFDRQTISLWQQVTGRSFAGDFKGRELDRLPVRMVSFGAWREAHPDGKVMEEPADGFDYGRDAYAGYGRDVLSESKYFRAPPESGSGTRTDPRLPPKWRVIGVQEGKRAVAFPMPESGRRAVAHALLDGTPLVTFFQKDGAETSTAPRLEDGRRGWSGVVYQAELDGRRLSFRTGGGSFVEISTGSRFDFFGRAISGPMKGEELRPVDQVTAFWFSWADSYPRTKVATS
ncbi:MAG: DUF3179 domain-containing protein [Actinomycetota bacterium]